jgi:hypothetical protein
VSEDKEIEEIWRELRHTLRKLSDIYEIHYSTMYTAVREAAEKVIKENKK